MRVGSLFAGIGGIELGFEMASPVFHTVFQVEREPFPRAVLAKHWPDALRLEDVRDVSRFTVPGVDLLCGGFPCQPHSVAGKRGGAGDERDLWPEFARIIGDLMPRWVVAENVPGLLSNDAGRFFGGVLRDLARLGFDAEWHRFPAAAVGAHHERQRVFIVAWNVDNALRFGREPGRDDHAQHDGNFVGPAGEYAAALAYPNGERGDRGGALSEQTRQPESQDRRTDVAYPNREGPSGRVNERGGETQHAHASHSSTSLAHADRLRESQPEGGQPNERGWAGDSGERRGPLADALRSGREEQHAPAQPGWAGQHSGRGDAPNWAGGGWEQPSPTAVSAVRGMANGFPGRVDRLKALGNAVVPQAAAVIGRAIVEAEAWREMTGELPPQIVLPRHVWRTA